MGFGVLLPVLAIVRNWSLDKQDFWAFFADVISGAFLLFAVWKVSQKERVGKRYLAAAWGLVCGLFYSSFAYQVVTINAGSKPEMGEPMIPDDAEIAHEGEFFTLALASAPGGLPMTNGNFAAKL